ncbi:MAG: hypothetical protein FWF10_07165 [Clostridiales bacterium]|nr:hypothetical protein [Clostridiales bacterium]
MEQQNFPPPQTRPEPQGDKVTSIGNWIGTMFLLAIPVVNFIMAIVWAVSAESKSKRNYFRAYWIMVAISFVLIIALVILIAVTGFTIFEYFPEFSANF